MFLLFNYKSRVQISEISVKKNTKFGKDPLKMKLSHWTT